MALLLAWTFGKGWLLLIVVPLLADLRSMVIQDANKSTQLPLYCLRKDFDNKVCVL